MRSERHLCAGGRALQPVPKGTPVNITVLAVGTKMPRWVDEAVGEYAKRFGRDIRYVLK